MNFDEMDTQHTEQIVKLDRILEMNTRLVRDARNAKTKSQMKGSARGAVLELVVSAIAVVWLGNFIAGHIGELQFLVPAVLLDICAIAFLLARVLQLSVIGALDYEGEVDALQNGLEQLRQLRARTSKWVATLSFVLWPPVLIVGVKGLLGVDPLQIVAAVSAQEPSIYAWIVANLAFAIAATLGAIWVSNRKSDRSAPVRA